MATTPRPISADKAAVLDAHRVKGGRFGFQEHAPGATLTGQGSAAATAVMEHPQARWETINMDTFRAEQTPESRNTQMQWELAKELSELNGGDVWSNLDEAATFMSDNPAEAAEMVGVRSLDASTDFSAANLPVISGGETLGQMEGISRRGDNLWQADLTALYTGAETARAAGQVETPEDRTSHRNIIAAVALNQRTAPEVLDRIVGSYLDGDDDFRGHARNSLINANTGEDTLMKALRRSTDPDVSSIAGDMLERRYEEERPSVFKWAAFKAVEAISDIRRMTR